MSTLQDDQNKPQDGEQSGLQRVGERLKAARVQNGVEVEQVAAELRLAPKTIIALEEHDDAQLPPATYIAGYIRSYAKLFDLPAEELVSQYEDRGVKPAPIVSTASTGDSIEHKGAMRFVTYAIVMVLLVMVALWWVGRDGESEPEQQGAAEEQAAPAGEGNAQSLPLTEESRPAFGEPSMQTGDGETAEAVAQKPAAQKPAASMSGGDGANTDGTSSAQVSEESKPEKSVQEETATAAVTPEKPLAPAPPTLTPETPQSTLTLNFSEDCWTEVTDAQGRRLYYSLAEAGSDVELHGEAPFRVFLGYAPGVTVQYNGVVFDHTPYQRNDIARFRVGRAADNAPLNEQ